MLNEVKHLVVALRATANPQNDNHDLGRDCLREQLAVLQLPFASDSDLS